MRKDLKLFLKTNTVLLSAMVTSPLYAQTTESDQAGLEEIIVTAQRRVESSQRAAVAIDVATPSDLERVGAGTANGLNAVAPSLYVTRAGGASTSYFIRGVGNFTNNSFSDPAVAFSLNGVYLGRPTSTTGTFFDLERVEVLKGPQGTLYGRNATGGAINVLYQKPKIGEVSGYASAGYGNYDSVDLEGAINLPIGTEGAVRLSGKLVDQDGFNQDGTYDEKGEALRGQMFAQLTDGLSMNIVADWAHTGGVGPGASYNGTLRFAPGTPASANAPANYVFSAAPSNLGPRTGLYSPEAGAYRSTIVIGGGFINPGTPDRSYQDTTNWGVSSEIKADLGAAELTLIPAYRETKLDFASPGPGFKSFVVKEQNRQFSIEARLAGSVGPVDWLLGGYHFDEDISAGQTINQYFVQSIQAFDTGTTSNAAFGRLTFNVSDAFRLVGGLRYTQDKKYFDAVVQTIVVPCTNAAPPGGAGCFGGPSMPTGMTLAEVAAQIPAAQLPFGFPTAPGPANARPYGSNGNILFYLPTVIDSRVTNSRATYRLSAEYDITPSSLLYASYETGYRSGGFNVALGRESYAPEYIEAFTIGSKNRFFGNRLQLNLEAFHWTSLTWEKSARVSCLSVTAWKWKRGLPMGRCCSAGFRRKSRKAEHAA
ncbi:iron complex outermembrane receptor protein [Sphingobium xenophagum]|uniref:Iron complex outermembrane receptor protein n=1 Tax=Sphingobium xenophagum TaxID=121428 RepID=A0ABU1WZ70_SPHXE|nr:TonB-dependent receptor [Sphingobium xenophagum]MDR7154344.1 iron complex outermembrane receptor protein [Sphingobium xenophagum]